MTAHTHTDDLHLLLDTLPGTLQDALQAQPLADLLEIVMDLGRPAQARFPGRAVQLSGQPVSHGELNHVTAAVGEFGADNRAGIEGTLHRISAIRNRKGTIVGLTLRVGRAVFGTIDLIRDLVESGGSVLLLGRPGVGKTTKLREIARVLADEFGKRVIVIDTSNEIGGDGDVPHPAIGSARRMQVGHPDQQHGVLIEAVENHMPEVIVVDEIGTAAETIAARTIAERGVQLIGTAHGTTLQNLVLNPTLSDLIGGVQTVTLSDEEARLRGTRKTVSERKAPPTFGSVVEIVEREEVIVHRDTAQAVDRLLRGLDSGGVRRTAEGEFQPAPERERVPPQTPREAPLPPREIKGTVCIYPYALSRDSVERAIRELRLDARTVREPQQAHVIVTLRARAEDRRLGHIVEATGLPLFLVKKNTTAQIRRLLQGIFNIVPGLGDDEVEDAVRETEEAVHRVREDGVVVALEPRPPAVRRLQHRIVAGHHLLAESVGREPQRHLVIHPG